MLRQAIQQNPSDAQSYNMLAYALAGQKRLPEAVTAAHNALKLSPADGNILDTVADMHQRRKEYTTAEGYYKQSLEHGNSNSSETLEKYGETLLALGKKDEGIAELKKAMNSQDAWGQKARQKLAALGQ